MRTFSVKSKINDDVACLYLKGHLDAHHVDRFEKEMVKTIGNGMVKIIINGQQLSYISSAGMGIIMGYLDEVREKGGDIKLCELSEQVYEIFDLVGFTDIYEFLKNEAEAMERFKDVSAKA